MSNTAALAAAANFIKEDMDDHVTRAMDLALTDLYSGPDAADYDDPDDDEVEEDERIDDYADALDVLREFWAEYGVELWYDDDAGFLTTEEPEEFEDCGECDPEDPDDDCEACEGNGDVECDNSCWIHMSATEVKREVFGALVTDGGL